MDYNLFENLEDNTDPWNQKYGTGSAEEFTHEERTALEMLLNEYEDSHYALLV